MPTTYYKLHGGRLTVAEYWRIAPDIFSFTIAVGMKPFGGFPFNFSIPRCDTLKEVDWDDLPPVVVRQFKEPVQAFERAGFDFVFCHELPVLERNRMGMGAALLSKDKKTFATVNYAQDPNTRQRQLNCVTAFDDDTFGVTTTAKLTMNPPPEYHTFRYPNLEKDAEELYDRHVEHLAEWKSDGFKVVPLDEKAVRAQVLHGEQRHVDFNIDRRVYIPMAKAEIRKIRDDQDDD